MQKGFAPILLLITILILVTLAAGAYYFGKSQTSKPQTQNQVVVSQTLQPTSAPSSSPDTSPVPNGTGEIANWKTYTNIDAKFSIQHPSLMVYTEQFLSDSKKLKRVTFDGDEGTIKITYALVGEKTAWGGGCDFDQHKKIIFLDQEKEVCLGDDYVSLYASHPKKIADFNFYAKFSPDNKGLILNILSTFRFD